MILKNKPIWLRWAVIFSLISISFFLVSLFIYLPHINENNPPFIFIPFALTAYPILSLWLMLYPFKGKAAELVGLFIAGTINWFLVGAILGWIVGKIRPKKI